MGVFGNMQQQSTAERLYIGKYPGRIQPMEARTKEGCGCNNSVETIMLHLRDFAYGNLLRADVGTWEKPTFLKSRRADRF
jgi:hypothetical protein